MDRTADTTYESKYVAISDVVRTHYMSFLIIGLLVRIDLFFAGWTMIMLSFAARRTARGS